MVLLRAVIIGQLDWGAASRSGWCAVLLAVLLLRFKPATSNGSQRFVPRVVLAEAPRGDAGGPEDAERCARSTHAVRSKSLVASAPTTTSAEGSSLDQGKSAQFSQAS